MSQNLPTLFIILVLTILSGVFDAQGFVHASKVWDGAKLVPSELGKSAAGFAVGIAMYWISVRYLNRIGSFTPEFQTLLWFGVTLIGVAVASRRFLSWSTIDQAVGFAVLVGIGWLFVRTGSQ
jgi:hypothetical protein